MTIKGKNGVTHWLGYHKTNAPTFLGDQRYYWYGFICVAEI